MSENAKLKHLEMTETVVARMATTSFLLKGWAVTLVTAILALGEKSEARARVIALALVPILVFWMLDGYFLYQERLYRELYDEVRVKDQEDIDFSLSTEGRHSLCKGLSAALAPTQLVFYLALLGLTLFAMSVFR
jgi:hypothetical protein